MRIFNGFKGRGTRASCFYWLFPRIRGTVATKIAIFEFLSQFMLRCLRIEFGIKIRRMLDEFIVGVIYTYIIRRRGMVQSGFTSYDFKHCVTSSHQKQKVTASKQRYTS